MLLVTDPQRGVFGNNDISVEFIQNYFYVIAMFLYLGQSFVDPAEQRLRIARHILGNLVALVLLDIVNRNPLMQAKRLKPPG